MAPAAAYPGARSNQLAVTISNAVFTPRGSMQEFPCLTDLGLQKEKEDP